MAAVAESVDREHDQADRQHGRRVGCPTLVIWALRDDMEDLYGDPLAIWNDWADDLRGSALDCGHHIAEEPPIALASELRRFLAVI